MAAPNGYGNSSQGEQDPEWLFPSSSARCVGEHECNAVNPVHPPILSGCSVPYCTVPNHPLSFRSPGDWSERVARTPPEMLQGTVDILILRTLAWEPMHGYAISRWLDARSDGVLSVDGAALYQ